MTDRSETPFSALLWEAVADDLAEALREALVDVGAKGVGDPTKTKGSIAGRAALARYEEAKHGA